MTPKDRKKRKAGEPEGVGDILDALKTSTGLGLKLQQAEVWDYWDEIAGEPYCRHATPHHLRDKRLVVAVDTPVWMHKLTYKRWDILEAINRRAGFELVSDIFFTLTPDDDPLPPHEGG